MRFRRVPRKPKRAEERVDISRRRFRKQNRMRMYTNEGDLLSGRVRRGRAVVVGLGLDDAKGHIRYTRGESYQLYGGSEAAHREMQRRAKIIHEEMAKQGISLDRMTLEQYRTLLDIVHRVNCK